MCHLIGQTIDHLFAQILTTIVVAEKSRQTFIIIILALKTLS
jgi:hypothetical protein